MDAAANREAWNRCEIQAFRPYPLAGECGIAMNHDGKDLFLAVGSDSYLFGPCAAHDDRVDCFKMARVRHQMYFDLLSIRGLEGARRADVVFHIPAAECAAWIDILELGEDVAGLFADDVDHHVQASAMAHAEHRLHDTVAGSALQQFIEKRNKGGQALKRKPLCAEIAGLDHLLKKIGARQQFERAGRIKMRLLRL